MKEAYEFSKKVHNLTGTTIKWKSALDQEDDSPIKRCALEAQTLFEDSERKQEILLGYWKDYRNRKTAASQKQLEIKERERLQKNQNKKRKSSSVNTRSNNSTTTTSTSTQLTLRNNHSKKPRLTIKDMSTEIDTVCNRVLSTPYNNLEEEEGGEQRLVHQTLPSGPYEDFDCALTSTSDLLESIKLEKYRAKKQGIQECHELAIRLNKAHKKIEEDYQHTTQMESQAKLCIINIADAIIQRAKDIDIGLTTKQKKTLSYKVEEIKAKLLIEENIDNIDDTEDEEEEECTWEEIDNDGTGGGGEKGGVSGSGSEEEEEEEEDREENSKLLTPSDPFKRFL